MIRLVAFALEAAVVEAVGWLQNVAVVAGVFEGEHWAAVVVSLTS